MSSIILKKMPPEGGDLFIFGGDDGVDDGVYVGFRDDSDADDPV